jgi:hypothetical protein
MMIEIPRQRGRPPLKLEALIDTGADCSLLRYDLIQRRAPELLNHMKHSRASLNGAFQEKTQPAGEVTLECTVERHTIMQKFIVAPLSNAAILGWDFITKNNVSWNGSTGEVWFDKSKVKNQPKRKKKEDRRICTLRSDLEVDAKSVKRSKFHVEDQPEGTTLFIDQTEIKKDLEIMEGLYEVNNSTVTVLMVNYAEEGCMLSAGLEVDSAETLEDCTVEDPPVLEVAEINTTEIPEDLPEELESLLTPLKEKISEDNVQKFRNLLLEYRNIFALKGEPLGQTSVVKHEINVDGHLPIRQAAWRTPMHRIDIVENAVKEMQEAGVIQPSESPWASPIVLVKKKDGSNRFCIDFRKLNDVTVKDAYPLPRIEDNLDVLEGSKFFSTLDLASGYWQVKVKEEDKCKTAFITRNGLWEFNVMPFGLCNAPATFQRLMEKILSGLQWKTLALYLDDVIVFATTLDEHIARLKEVFQRIQGAGLKLKPKKCDFLRESVNFLGHLVDSNGIRTDPEKISKIKDWPRPTSVTEVRTFIGLTSYYRKFIKGYAKIAAPLHELTKKDSRFYWSEECELAMKTLQQELLKDTILALPQKDGGQFILDTDASNVAIGAVLSQVQNGKEMLIACGSRCLSKAERNYCVTRRELLAVVHFMLYFKYYLLGHEILVRTDHGSLTWLKNMRNPCDQVARWTEALSRFDWKIVHRKGLKHNNADALSRRPCPGDCSQCIKMMKESTEPHEEDNDVFIINSSETQEDCPIDDDTMELPTLDDILDVEYPVEPLPPDVAEHFNAVNFMELPSSECLDLEQYVHAIDLHPKTKGLPLEQIYSIWDEDSIKQAMEEDPDLKIVLAWKSKPKWEDMAMESPSIKHYWQNFDRLRDDNKGFLWYKWLLDTGQHTWKLVIPKRLQRKILQQLHDSPSAGHLSYGRCKTTLDRLPIYWFGCKRDLHLYCMACDDCITCKPRTKHIRNPMMSYGAGAPLERMAVDICGPLHETLQGNKYIIVVMDYFTKWCELIPSIDHTAETVATELITKVFTRIGVPRALHSDQGTEFLSKLFEETCRVFQIDKTKTSPWRPQSDGLVERLNRTVGSMLRQYVNKDQTDWDTWLPLVSMAYNSTVQYSTKFSPYYLMYGREMTLPIELVLPPVGETFQDEDTPEITPTSYAEQLTKRLEDTFTLVRNNLKTAVNWQKTIYNRKVHQVPLTVGQGVWYYCPQKRKGRTPKLDRPYIGPFAIVNIFGGGLLAEIKLGRRYMSKYVHVNKLVPVKGNYDGSWIKNLPPKDASHLEDIKKMLENPKYYQPPDDQAPVIHDMSNQKKQSEGYQGPITRSKAKQLEATEC